MLGGDIRPYPTAMPGGLRIHKAAVNMPGRKAPVLLTSVESSPRADRKLVHSEWWECGDGGVPKP